MPLEITQQIAKTTANLIHYYDETIIDPLEALSRGRGNCFTRAIAACCIGLSLDIDSFLMHIPRRPEENPPHAQALFYVNGSPFVIDSHTGDGYGGFGVIVRNAVFATWDVAFNQLGTNNPDFHTTEIKRRFRVQSPEPGYYDYLRGRVAQIINFSEVVEAVHSGL